MNEMMNDSSFTAPPEIEHEDFSEPSIELPIAVAPQERKTQQREEEFSGAPSFTGSVSCASSALDNAGRFDRPKPRRKRRTEDISLSHHAARCSICQHPDRDAIEQAFLHWERPGDIAYHFGLGSRLVVYRHARALALSQRRNERGQHALGYLIEQAQSVKPTADSIIRAVKALSCFDADGRYREPRKEVVITHQIINVTAPAALPSPAPADRSIPAREYSIPPAACPEAITGGLASSADPPMLLKIELAEPAELHSLATRPPVAGEGSRVPLPAQQTAAPTDARGVGPASPLACPESASDGRRVTRHSLLQSELIDTRDEQKKGLTQAESLR